MVQSLHSVNGEMQADAEAVDGKTAADTILYHKGSAEKNKSNTIKTQVFIILILLLCVIKIYDGSLKVYVKLSFF